MAGSHLLVLLGLLAAVIAPLAARSTPAGDVGVAYAGHAQQSTRCARIPHCSECRLERRTGMTVLSCSECADGYQASDDNLSCECAPGFYPTNGGCEECGTGYWCAGGTSDRTPCGTGMTTLITYSDRREQCVTLPGYGVASDGSTLLCPHDTWGAGGARIPCRACPLGFHTASAGAAHADACKPPPAKAGVTVNMRHPLADMAMVRPCPEAPQDEWDVVAAEEEAALEEEGDDDGGAEPTVQDPRGCFTCRAGYGVASGERECAACPAGTYSPGRSVVCYRCPTGLTSAALSASQDDCYAAWQAVPVAFDTIPAPAALAAPGAAARSAGACKATCTGACMFYQWDASHARCLLSMAAGPKAVDRIGFKVAPGVYTYWPWDAKTPIGDGFEPGTPLLARAAAAKTPEACQQACDDTEECILVVWKPTTKTCIVRAPAMDADVRGCEFRAIGSQINSL